GAPVCHHLSPQSAPPPPDPLPIGRSARHWPHPQEGPAPVFWRRSGENPPGQPGRTSSSARHEPQGGGGGKGTSVDMAAHASGPENGYAQTGPSPGSPH